MRVEARATRARGAAVGAILAGGLATRYGGTRKGLERVGGERIIDRVAGALRDVCEGLLLVANDPTADEWLRGVRRVADVMTGQGSLGGIHAALSHAGAPVLLVAWDMPFVPPSLLADLATLGASGADAAVPESDSRRGLEPLCAYYASTCLAPVERRLAAGDRRVVGFYDEVRLARLPAERVARHGDPSRIFMNVNTPDDLALAEAFVAEANGATADGGRDRPEA
jgi:molybdopterin-guanine dinucleotide biosynthesis protein A